MILRQASLSELSCILDWAADEGWNPGRDDAAAFHASDPDGFFVAEIDGQIMAAISVVNHDATLAFLGLYLCCPAYRGQGIGFALWSHALAHAGTRTVGLDGVADQQDNYARSGFVRTGATARYEGSLAALEAGPDKAEAGSEDLRACRDADTEAVAALDLAANGFARPAFLSVWCRDAADRKTTLLWRDGAVAGMATARLCRDGSKIGPLVAPDQAGALALVGAAARSVGATQLIVDVPETQPGFQAALDAHGFVSGFATARMYRGAPPRPAAPATLWGVATLELG